MKKSAILLLLCLSLLPMNPVWAVVNIEQFAYGLPLSATGAQALYEVELPLAVYRGSQRPDLGDLRVFNAARQVVPHALRRPANQVQQQNVVMTELPFFPLPDLKTEADLSVQVKRSVTGTVIHVRATEQATLPQDHSTGSYLIDASAHKQPIATLELLWNDDTPAFLGELIVETSQDLVRWRQLKKAAIGRLRHQTFRFDQNKIDLPRANRRYLRLRWAKTQPPRHVNLTGVRVLGYSSDTIRYPAQQHLQITAEAAGERRYKVDLQAALPISALRIFLPDKNSLAAIRLFSAEANGGPLRERWRGLQYNLATDGSNLTSPQIQLPAWQQTYWELRLDETEARLQTAPLLEFFWQPQKLIFLAQGEGPYTLAYGSKQVVPPKPLLNKLLRSPGAQQPRQIQPGKPFELGGSQVLSTWNQKPWRKYGLWGVLALGVLLIGGMSFSLYRKLRETES